jgi:ribonuclease HI
MKKRNKKSGFYVVWKGKTTGIFSNWEQVMDRIRDFANPRYMKVRTYEEAEFAQSMSYEKYKKEYRDKGTEGTTKSGTPLF